MKKVTEQIGKTVEEAIRKGLEELKISPSIETFQQQNKNEFTANRKTKINQMRKNK